MASLLACHVRIRHHTALAQRLATTRDAPTEQRVEAAQQLVRYFSRSLPAHARDEDESLLPRILAAGAPDDVTAALERMRREHAEQDAMLAALLPRWQRLAHDPREWDVLAAELAEGAAALAQHLEAHLVLEENVIFPSAERLLGAAQLSAVLDEIRSRRD
ncbi:MAG: hemerythrin domain-containing protein [Myxococcota bacterium]